MTAMRMRQHIAAGVWHFDEAAAEAPSIAALPPALRALMIGGHVVNLDHFGIDAGHVAEQGRVDNHLVPTETTADTSSSRPERRRRAPEVDR